VIWSTASIRARLTTWYTVVLSLMLVVYASATYLAVRHEFLEQLDDDLYDDFEAAQRSLSVGPDGRIAWASDRHHDSDNDPDRATELWSTDGQLIYQSAASLPLPAVAASAPTRVSKYESIITDGNQWRTLTGPAKVGGRTLLLRVSRSEDRVRGELEEVLTVLIVGFPIVIALAGAGGYLLASRALAPTDRLASEARRITAQRLHERVSVPNRQDEIGRLAAVINDTLARLESSFEQLRRFTSDASHELRTPLTVIRAIGEAGLAETRTPAAYQEAIGSMLEEVDRLTNLLDTLLRLSRADAGAIPLSPSALDLQRLTQDVTSSLGILAEERQQHLHVTGNDPVPVFADGQVLREAISNVLDNAVKYSPRGSRIDVSLRAEGSQAVLTIGDEGPGIPAELRDKVFDRFFRVDEGRSRDHGGAGLGLAIARWAVEASGGEISVDNKATGGSLFRITLPISGSLAGDDSASVSKGIGGHT